MDKITILIVIAFVGIVSFLIYDGYKHPCIISHFETQYEAPIGMVVGGSKYGGGVSIPMGNMKPVQVEVCDLHK